MIAQVPIPLLWLLPLIGMAAYIAAHHLGLWAGNRRESLHLWAFGWCANTLCYLSSRAIQVASHSPEQAAFAARLGWVSALFLVPLVVGLSYALADRRLPQYLMRGVIGLTASLLAVLWLTPAILTGQTYVRTEWPGFQYGAPLPGPLMTALVPYFLLVFVHCFWTVWSSTVLESRERWIVLTAFVLYIFCAVNDVLHVSRVINSIRLFDLAFVAIGVGLTFLMVRRSNHLHTRLEEEVSARTVELRLRVASLEALTKLNKLISSSLDRDEVLRGITEAATRLMGVPVALLCVADEDQRSLEVVAFSDPEAGADFPLRTIAFDQGILGWIATHRQPVNVPDIFQDDRFVAFEWWRARGLRSFYGVPVVLDGALLAVLALDGTGPFHFLPEERDLLESFVAQAAVAIRNASTYRAEGNARAAAEAALAQVKQLQGLLPICSYCKKIRDDRNYWERIETYISERSEVAFSHGVCPECHDTIVAPQLEQWRQAQTPGRRARDMSVIGERPPVR